jgi:hypothetical protein
LTSYLKEKVVAPVYKAEITALGDQPHSPFGTKFADKRRSLMDVLLRRSSDSANIIPLVLSQTVLC